MNLRKRILSLVLSVMMLLSMSGCMLFEAVLRISDDLVNESIDNRGNLVEFADMEYERPDIDDISDKADDVRELIDDGESGNDFLVAYEDFYDSYLHFLTMANIALIRSDLDIDDDYYADENDWCSENGAEVERILDDLLRYCANSDICDELDEKYFDGYLEENYAEDASFEYTDELVALYAKESVLVSSYYEISVQMAYTDLSETEAWDEFNRSAAEIYIRLIKVRRDIAEEAGYDSYVDMAYEQFGREYGPEDIEDYTAAIKKHITPLYIESLYSGVFFSIYDIGSMRPERSFRNVKGCLTELDPTIADIMSFMQEYKLYDIANSDSKIANSYTTYLYDYDAPFMFVCPESDKSDMLTIAHEFGHFCDEYMNYNAGYSLDTAEMMSQGMEYMLITHLDDEELCEELTEYKLLNELSLYVDQGCYSEFEHRAFELSDDELTVDNLNALFAEVADDYGFSEAYYPEYLNYIWIQIPHMFEYPFYVISYCISDSAAFNIYTKELDDPGSGLEVYLELVSDSAAADFLEFIDDHGLPSPISAKTVKNIAAVIEEQLDLG